VVRRAHPGTQATPERLYCGPRRRSWPRSGTAVAGESIRRDLPLARTSSLRESLTFPELGDILPAALFRFITGLISPLLPRSELSPRVRLRESHPLPAARSRPAEARARIRSAELPVLHQPRNRIRTAAGSPWPGDYNGFLSSRRGRLVEDKPAREFGSATRVGESCQAVRPSPQLQHGAGRGLPSLTSPRERAASDCPVLGAQRSRSDL